jgi:hypothetical protein
VTKSGKARKLNAAINEVMKSQEVQAGLATVGGEAMIGSPQDFVVHIAAETRNWATIAKSAPRLAAIGFIRSTRPEYSGELLTATGRKCQ